MDGSNTQKDTTGGCRTHRGVAHKDGDSLFGVSTVLFPKFLPIEDLTNGVVFFGTQGKQSCHVFLCQPTHVIGICGCRMISHQFRLLLHDTTCVALSTFWVL